MVKKYKKLIAESAFYKNFRTVLSVSFHYFHKKFLWGIFSSIDEKFIKFLFVGILNTIFAYFIYAFFVTIGINANISLFCQYILGVLWNFKTTGAIVFKNHDNRLIFKFVGSYIFTFIINSILLKVLTIYFNDYIAQALLVPPVAILSFLLFKFWVFKEKK